MKDTLGIGGDGMKIDFVVTWVDGNDRQWQQKKAQYEEHKTAKADADANAARYRDWGFFHYWFRSVEKNAPWVNQVFLVTDRQIPDFIQTNHPKLKIVYHDQYIPQEYLPTFSSHTIELNFHRLPGLSEYFVYFNDDTLLNRPVQPTDFFRNGKPCYELIERPLEPHYPMDLVNYVAINNMAVVNNHHNRKRSLPYIGKCLHPRYGKSAVKNIFMLFWKKYQHFQDNHMPCPHLKSTFVDVWDKAFDACNQTCLNRFRKHSDLNQFVFRYWELAKGNFVPYSFTGGYYSIGNSDIDECVRDIIHGKHLMICLNDGIQGENFEELAKLLQNAFAERYPEKCSFEL